MSTGLPPGPPEVDPTGAAPQELFEQAVAAYRRGDWAEAGEALPRGPRHRRRRFDGAAPPRDHRRANGRPHEANGAARASRNGSNRTTPRVHNTRGVALRELGRYRRGTRQLRSRDRDRSRIRRGARESRRRAAQSRAARRGPAKLRTGDRAEARISPEAHEQSRHRTRASSGATPRRWRATCGRSQIKPDYPYLYGSWLHAKMQICDWTQTLRAISSASQGKVERLEKAAIAVPTSRDSVPRRPCSARPRKSSSMTNIPKVHAARRDSPGKRPHEQDPHRLFFGGFPRARDGILIAELFERHDRTKIRADARSRSARDQSTPMRKRLAAAFDDFIEVRKRTDRRSARLARGDARDRHRGRSEGLHPQRPARHIRPSGRADPGELSGLSRHDGRRLYRLSRSRMRR